MPAILHNIPPVYDNDSRILILGSFPSVASRESKFYYGHKNNRFWKVLSHLYKETIGENPLDKQSFLIAHNIALWDVIKSCDICGSLDSSIKNVTVNDIKSIITDSNISRVYTNGKTSDMLYKKYILSDVGIEAICLPSTSSANASFSFEELCGKWSMILN